jgi:predicted metal-dependent enzyme (double-stranded beta helix superfamily)
MGDIPVNDIEKLSQDFQKIIERKPALPQLIEQSRSLLTEFTSNTRWFHEFIENKLFDSEFFLSQLNSIWPNEIALFRSPDRDLSILAYIWAPHSVDTIHDHGAWGVLAPLVQPFRERKYRRQDDGTIEGYAELQEISYKTIRPGESTYVLPLNDGIHRIENISDNYVMSLNVYGQPVRHVYVQFFDAEQKKVWKAYPPRTHKQIMTIRAMGNISEPWVKQLLTDAMKKDIPDFIKNECQLSLEKFGKV